MVLLLSIRVSIFPEADDWKSIVGTCAEIIAGLSSPVEREIYGNRAADAANLSHKAMADEVERLRQRRQDPLRHDPDAPGK